MSISIFLSRATPYNDLQKLFLKRVATYLHARGIAGRTIGDTDYGREPMPHIRGVMTDCNGFLGIGFRRFHVAEGEDRPKASPKEFLQIRGRVTDQWMTSPYLHLESAIAYHIGLPILMIVETGVILEGALDPGVMTVHAPKFTLDDRASIDSFVKSEQWKQLVNTWEGEVREVVHTKGRPPRLYQR